MARRANQIRYHFPPSTAGIALCLCWDSASTEADSGSSSRTRCPRRKVEAVLHGRDDPWNVQLGRDVTSSSLHLEVVSVLRLLDVEFDLEYRENPFMLDCRISPQQLAGISAAPEPRQEAE